MNQCMWEQTIEPGGTSRYTKKERSNEEYEEKAGSTAPLVAHDYARKKREGGKKSVFELQLRKKDADCWSRVKGKGGGEGGTILLRTTKKEGERGGGGS